MTGKMRRILLYLIAMTIISTAMAFGTVVVTCTSGAESGTHSCRVRIEPGERQTFWLAFDCSNCHKTPLKSGQDLQKSFDLKSQIAHSEKYLFSYGPKDVNPASRFEVKDGTRYQIEKGVYILRRNGQLILVNESENYKLVFQADAVIVKNRYGTPWLITTDFDVVKTSPLGPKDIGLIR